MIKKSYVLTLLLFACLFFNGFAQEKKGNEYRILIVPFSRFDFQTTYALTEIAEVNAWNNAEEVFSRYRDTLVHSLSTKYNNISAFPIPVYEYGLIKNKLPRVYKEKPSTHFGVDLSLLKQNNQLKTLVDNLSADYILFISRYEISSRLVASMSSHNGSKFLPWSNHEVTYELFDANGKLVVMADQFKVLPKSPNIQNINSKGLLLNEVAPNYEHLLEDISLKLAQYHNQRKKKAVYRLNIR